MPKPPKNAQKDLISLIKLAKKSGLKRIKTGDIELEFHVEHKENTRPEVGRSVIDDLPKERMPSDDEMLYASTQYFDDLVAQRTGNVKPVGSPNETN